MLSVRKLVMGMVLAATTAVSVAEEYPNRPITLIVPFPPGQSADTLMRIVGEGLSTRFKQPVVIENKPGAGGVIGTQYVASQQPDGYTLLMGGSGPMSIIPSLQPTIAKYDAVKNFTSIAGVGSIAQVLVVPANSKIKTLNDLVSEAKKNPNQLTFGTSGQGTTQHLFMEMLMSTASFKLTHVPYKGSSPALTDLISGQIDVMSDTITAMAPHIKAGRVRPLAVTSAKRWYSLPEVPTIAEQGYPTYAAEGWITILGPAGMKPEVVGKLESTIRSVLADPAVQKKFAEQSFGALNLSPTQLQAFLSAETTKWRKVIQTAGINVE